MALLKRFFQNCFFHYLDKKSILYFKTQFSRGYQLFRNKMSNNFTYTFFKIKIGFFLALSCYIHNQCKYPILITFLSLVTCSITFHIALRRKIHLPKTLLIIGVLWQSILIKTWSLFDFSAESQKLSVPRYSSVCRWAYHQCKHLQLVVSEQFGDPKLI